MRMISGYEKDPPSQLMFWATVIGLTLIVVGLRWAGLW